MDPSVESQREAAIRRIKAKRDFRLHLVIYLAVNALLVAIWLFSGGFFWPIFVIGGWGIGVAVNWYVAYHSNVISEDQIQREMKNLR